MKYIKVIAFSLNAAKRKTTIKIALDIQEAINFTREFAKNNQPEYKGDGDYSTWDFVQTKDGEFKEYNNQRYFNNRWGWLDANSYFILEEINEEALKEFIEQEEKKIEDLRLEMEKEIQKKNEELSNVLVDVLDIVREDNKL